FELSVPADKHDVARPETIGLKPSSEPTERLITGSDGRGCLYVNGRMNAMGRKDLSTRSGLAAMRGAPLNHHGHEGGEACVLGHRLADSGLPSARRPALRSCDLRIRVSPFVRVLQRKLQGRDYRLRAAQVHDDLVVGTVDAYHPFSCLEQARVRFG